VRSLAGNLAYIVFFSLLCTTLCTTQTTRPQSGAQSHAQFTAPGPLAQVARDYAWRPALADVLPLAQGAIVGDRVPLRIVLLDASGKLTNALERTALVIEATGPSGKKVTENLEVAPGASSVDLSFQAMEPGLTKVIVRQPQDQILDSSNFVLINPVQLAPPVPQLMFRVSGERDSNVRADGVSYERIGVYYVDSQPARFPVAIWLTWSHGEVKPNPLILKKGERFAEAHWTSGSPVETASVAIAGIKPAIPVNGVREGHIKFVEPVSGVAFLNPPATMSIVDDYSLHARFYDLGGNFIKTSDKRKVTVSTSSPIVRFKPDARETDWDFQTDLIPTSWGKAEIAVATPGYPPFTHTILITYLEVLWVCMAGGLLGGLVDVFISPNARWGRRFTASFMVGIPAALLACWAYVVRVLPFAPAGILHSRIAVLGVSLIAGWAGVFAFRKVATALGMEV
jgi:hypothetical protein